MHRRNLIKMSGVVAAIPLAASTARAAPACPSSSTVVWKRMITPAANIPALDGHADTVPDVVGRLGVPIALAIFTEGNHFPALLGGEIIEPFRAWAKRHPQYATVPLDNIVVVTLPQPMIVAAIQGRGIALGNLTLVVSRENGFYPDIVMGGTAPLQALRKAGVVEPQARVFARNRGLSLLVAAGNPLAISQLDDLARPDVRVVMASASEPGARAGYTSALEGMLGREKTASILAHETVTFPGRLGIQHRDVLQAIATRQADVGIILRHLASYYANTYPLLCDMVTVPGAERFSSTLAMATTHQQLRAQAGKAFSEFFLRVAGEVYPRYEFALMDKSEFGAAISLG